MIQEDLIDFVFVLRTKNEQLYDRLEKRGYEGKKLEENLQCEIFQTILDEAKQLFDEEQIVELESNEMSDLDTNCERVCDWIKMWIKENTASTVNGKRKRSDDEDDEREGH